MGAQWTVIVYMVADTGPSFYRAAMNDITEMTEAKFDDRVKVVVHAVAPSPWLPKCWEVKNGNVTEIDCGDMCLLDFVKMCVSNPNYEAEKYLLVLWGHGEGIDWKEKVLANTKMVVLGDKGFAPGSGGFMKIAELGRAIAQLKTELKTELGKEIKAENLVVGFDSCLMALVEVYYEIHRHVGWVVAANDEIPDTGWPYEKILNRLGDVPDMFPEQLARAIVEECADSYSDESNESDVSFSACKLEKIELLKIEVIKLREALGEHMLTVSGLKAIREARDFAEDLKEKAYVDLNAFCSKLADLKDNKSVLSSLGKAADAVVVALREFVTQHKFSDEYPYRYTKESRAVSICFPESKDLKGSLPGYEIDWESYMKLDFTDQTAWHEFLKSYWPEP